MALKLMYITNDYRIAKIAEDSGVDWIFIDLEIIGKEKRQGHLDSVISHHKIDDIKSIKSEVKKAELLVRVNPIYEGSKEEINKVIECGADIVMLPFFKTKEEVEKFINYINGRVKVCLLLETPEAAESVDSILSIENIDFVHIGLNDLHLGYGKKFMFELLADGTVETLCNKIRDKGISFGFGGIAQIGEGKLPAENIIAEHYRLNSSMVILSRSFCDTNKVKDSDQIARVFNEGVLKIREYENELLFKDINFFQENRNFINRKVAEILRG